MPESRRRLPHKYPEGKWLFITWHLHGSLPSSLYPPPGKRNGEAFVWMDRYLDTVRSGPMYLRRDDIARIMVHQLKLAVELQYCDLSAYVLMANHVHVLLLPKIPPPKLLHFLKGASARESNRVLCRTGKFWQTESYDHWVRDSLEFERIAAYIENNPVRAGLVAHSQDYPWSSACVDQQIEMNLDPAR
jgi:REP element-mobilizing transposase RayT